MGLFPHSSYLRPQALQRLASAPLDGAPSSAGGRDQPFLHTGEDVKPQLAQLSASRREEINHSASAKAHLHDPSIGQAFMPCFSIHPPRPSPRSHLFFHCG